MLAMHVSYQTLFSICKPKSKMGRLWHFCTVVLLLHQCLHISSSSSSSSSSSLLTDNLFESWCKEHGKTYSSEQEKQFRIRILEENYDYITQHNSKGNSTYNLSLNAFADLTHHEFKAMYLMGQHLSLSVNDLEYSSALLEAIAAGKPVSVGICGSDRPFQFYYGGIFTGPCCDTLDHSVLIVGYNYSRNDVEYWNVKNSWGTSWGINGYMHLARWKGNSSSCGTNREVITNYLVKTTSPNPPSPWPPNGHTCFPLGCRNHSDTCCCYKRRLSLCKKAGCCGSDYPVCCKANLICCPKDYPNCVEGKRHCFKKLDNITLTVPAKMAELHAVLIN